MTGTGPLHALRARNEEALHRMAEEAVQEALRAGADAAEAFIHESHSRSITCKGAFAYPKDAHAIGIGLRLAVGRRIGLAGTSGLHRIPETIEAALQNARAAPERPTFEGFAMVRPFSRPPTEVHPVIEAGDPTRLEDLARRTLEGLDSSETTFSAVHIQSGESRFCVANNSGVLAWDRSGRESILIENRVTRGGRNVTAWDTATGRLPLEEHQDLIALAQGVTERARQALGPRPLERPVGEVVFGPSAVGQLMARYAEGFSGSLVRSGQSPLSDHRDQQVADPGFTLLDVPYGDGVGQRLRTDHEGVPTEPRPLVKSGVLAGFLYDTLTAQAAGCEPTGNALRSGAWSGGVGIRPIHPTVLPGRGSIDDLVGECDRAVMVSDAMTGMFTTNATTGDFSATAPYAFLVERGEVKQALPNTTIGGNIHDMLQRIRGIGGDVVERRTGSYPPICFGGVSCAN